MALEPAGSNRMLSAGRDGRLALWDLAAKRILVERTFSAWPRAVAVSPDGTRAAIQTNHTQLISLPDLKNQPFRVRSLRRAPISIGIARCLTFDAQGALVAGQFNGQVLVYEPKANRRSFSRELLLTHPTQVVDVQLVPGHPYLVSGCQSGAASEGEYWISY